METFFITAAVCLGLTLTACNNTEKEDIALIQTFYNKYVSESYTPADESTYLSPCLLPKIARMTEDLNADPITSSQDMWPEMLKQLTVTPVKKHWYKVSYIAPYETEPTNIFVKVENQKITAVYPWEVDIDAYETPFTPQPIQQTDALTFVQTFYSNYLNLYAGCTENFDKEIKAMQQKYCSERLLRQIARTHDEHLGDIDPNYDLLIQGSDFDKSFLKSLKVTQEQDYIQLQYKGMFGYEAKIQVRTAQQPDGTYLLDEILYTD